MIRHLDWLYTRYNGVSERWAFDLFIPDELYALYRNTPRYFPIRYELYPADPRDEPFFFGWLPQLVTGARNQGYAPLEIAELLLNMVASLAYYPEEGEYPRYPVETLWDGGGDCEDVAILTAKLWRLTGFGTALLELEDAHHMAVGLLATGLQGYFFQGPGGTYYYAEATNAGVYPNAVRRIGEVPQFIGPTKVRILPVPGHPSPILR